MTDNDNRGSQAQQQLDEILAELMRAIDAGQAIDSRQWLARYPEFAVELHEFFAQQERVEKLVGPLRHIAAKALHVRCPHCHNPIELLDSAALTDISCPSCGSSFSLVGDGTVSHFQPGERTVGHFQLLDRVGVGQFGSVWKARDTKLDRTVAIKIPRNSQLDGSQAELFLRDARAAAQLNHPNIVSVHEVGKQDQTVYIVSDFVHGATLKEWLAAKRLTPREAAELCIKIAKALHHAHESGVIHRDLKPSNIMMDVHGEPHIVDFGLAKREVGEVTMTAEGQILGTPAYMSPEQARGEGHTVDRSVDVYSLGVILFEMLTDELPFRGDKQMLIVQILNDDPPSPRKLDSSVPRDLETVCLKCLEKDASKRYVTAQQLADDLSRWLSGRSIQARPPGTTERVTKWVKRRPAAAALIVMSTLALLFCAGMVVNVWNRSRVEAINRRLQQTNTELGMAVHDKNKANAKLQQAVKTADQSRETAHYLRRRADRYFYISQVQLADIALSEGRRRNAWAALERFIPRSKDDQDPRGIEWYYHWHKCRGQWLTLWGNGSDVLSVAFDSQGKLLATGSADGAVTVWDAASGHRSSQFELEDQNCVHLTFAPKGESVYCLQADGVVSHWSLSGERRSDLYAAASIVTSGVIVSRGEVVVTQATRFGKLRVQRPNSPTNDPEARWGISTGSPYRRSINGSRAPSGHKERLLFSVNRAGTLLAVATSHRQSNVLVHDISAADDTDSITLTFHGSVGCIAISDDGHLVAIGEGLSNHPVRNKNKDDYRISIWDIRTKSRITESTHDAAFTRAAFSPDGSRLVVASKDQTIRMWDLSNLRSSRAKHDGASRTIQTWELQELDTFYGQSEIRHFEFSPNGDRLAVADRSGIVRIWNAGNSDDLTTDPVESHAVCSGIIGDISFLARGKDVLVRSGKSLRVVHTASGEPVTEVDDLKDDQYGGRLGISPDYSSASDGKHLISLATPGVVRELNNGSTELFDVALDSTGEYIASAGAYRQRPAETVSHGATVSDVRTGEILHHFETPQHSPSATYGTWCSAVTFGDNATLITGTGTVFHEDRPQYVDLWSLQTGHHIRTLDRPNYSVWRLRISPDGTKLAAATGNYGRSYLNEILIWDLATGRLLHQLSGHKECVYDVDFSPDGTRLASVAGDFRARSPIGELFLWDVMTGEQMLSVVTEHGGLLCVDFDDTGHQIVAGSARGSIIVLRPQVPGD